MNILYVFADIPQEWNCSEWRCAIPGRVLNEQDNVTTQLMFIKYWAEDKEDCHEASEWADVIIIQRLPLFNVHHLIMRYRSKGKAVIVDLDDAYHMIKPSNITHSFWKEDIIARTEKTVSKFKVPTLQQLVEGCKLATALTVSSPKLAEDWKQFLPEENIFVVPNYMPDDFYIPRNRESRIKHNNTVLGWGGSLSHLASFGENIVKAITSVLQKRSNVSLLIAGGDSRIRSLFYKLPPEQVAITPWVRFSEWPKILTEFDIGLAPLDTTYDARRSWIKPMEYMLCEIPWISSNQSAYDEIEYGVFPDNRQSTWRNTINLMIDNYSHYENRTAEARKYAEQFLVSRNVDKLEAIYKEILCLTN